MDVVFLRIQTRFQVVTGVITRPKLLSYFVCLSKIRDFLFHKLGQLFNLVDPASLLLFVYIVAFFRQYFWSFDSNLIAWVFPILGSLALSTFFKKKLDYKGFNYKFFIIIGSPLLIFYLLRVPFPDFSWDIVNYHFINSERALMGYPFINGDFIYLAYSNPVSDMITGIFRNILGHRLGTIVNLLALLWSAQVLNKWLKHYCYCELRRYFVISFLLCFEGFTYQISNYWVDLLAIPIILELTYLIIFQKQKKICEFFLLAFLAGLALGIKLTNLYILIPLGIVFLAQFWLVQRQGVVQKIFILVLLVTVFLIPLIPYHSYMFDLTGNPIYPHFNAYFQSDLFNTDVPFDTTLGPVTGVQKLIWPLVMLWHAERLSPTPVWPILTFLGYVISWVVILTKLFCKNFSSNEVAVLSLVFFLSSTIWGFVSGDFRYVYFFEILGGLLVILFFLEIRNLESLKLVFFDRWKLQNLKIFRKIVMSFAVFGLVAKFALTLHLAIKFEWAGRPTIFSSYVEYRTNLSYLLDDYSLIELLPQKHKMQFVTAQAWISSSPVVSGFMVLLNKNIPYLDLHHLPLRGVAGEELFEKTVQANGPLVYTSVIQEGVLGYSLKKSIDELATQNFKPLSATRFTLPYFSHTPSNLINLIALEAVHENHISLVKERYNPTVIRRKQETLVAVEWPLGCSSVEQNKNSVWRWCADEFAIRLKNFSDVPLDVKVGFNVASTSHENSNLLVKSSNTPVIHRINNQASYVERVIRVDAGKEADISYMTDAPRLDAPGDPRVLHLKLTDFNITSLSVDGEDSN